MKTTTSTSRRTRRTPQVTRTDSPTASEARQSRVRMIPLEAAVNAVPTSWLDPLLTGPDAVIGIPRYTGIDIQRLLLAVSARIRNLR